jgi:sugar O-acyltransferase (sialic acid O-acetyltransferase NeuD family)
MQTNLVIIGTGDFAEVACKYLSVSYRIVAFSVEAAYQTQAHFMGVPVIAFEDLYRDRVPAGTQVFVAIGPSRSNSVRERIFIETINRGFSCIRFVHPNATICDSVRIGANCFIFPGVVVEPFVTLGDNCILWSNSTVAHHSTIESHTFLAPGAMVSGRSTIERNCFLGINCTVRDNVLVGAGSIIGAGAVVKSNVVAGSVLSAKPADALEQNAMETKV